MNYYAIQTVAEEILLKKGQPTIPIDIISLLNKDGFLVYPLPFHEIEGEQSTTGALLVSPSKLRSVESTKLIFLEETLPDQKRRFVAAHEYAHYVLHRKPSENEFYSKSFKNSEEHLEDHIEARNVFARRSDTMTDPEELEADTFARCLLMPEVLVRKEIFEFIQNNTSPTQTQLIDFTAEKFYVTPNKASIRLAELKIIHEK